MFHQSPKRMAVWRNPLSEMEKFHHEMNRLFDLGVVGKPDPEGSLLSGYWSPAVDVMDKKDQVVVKVDLPGLKKDDIDVSIENNVLSIRGEKRQESEHTEGDVIRSERYYGSFNRVFSLPAGVDSTKVNAKFENGVLELTLQKKEEAKPKQIKINVT
jgi:HSP20 family protein